MSIFPSIIRVLALGVAVLTLNPMEAQAQSVTPPDARLSATGSASDVQHWTSVEGESIVSMAQAMFPRDEGSRSFFVSRVLRANPGLLRSGLDAHSPLPTGTQLVIPSLLDLASAAALPPARSSPSNPRPVAREPSSALQPNTPPVELEVIQRDQLVIDTGGRDELATELLLGQVSATDREREVRLVAAIDRNIDLQRELLERIKRLEEVQEEIRRRLNTPADTPALIHASASRPATPVVPTMASQPAPHAEETIQSGTNNTESIDWLTWTLGGIAMSLLALMLWQRSHLKARQNHSYRENPNEDIWPDQAQSTGGFEPDVKTLAPRITERQAVADTASRANAANPAASGSPAARTPRSQLNSSAPAPASILPAVPDQRPPFRKDTNRSADDDSTLPPERFNKPDADSLFDDVPTQPPTLEQTDEPDEDVSAVELADLMIGFGRIDGAADALEAFIENNPRAAVKPWLKLTAVYHTAGKRQEFETVAANLHKTFNVQLPNWDEFGQTSLSSGVESMPHITERLEAIWGTRECQGYIDTLIRDNRQGTRSGFDLEALDDLLMLASVLDAQLGRFRSTHGIRN